MRSPVAERASTWSITARQNFFDTGQRDHGARQGETHPAVALRLDHHNRACFSDEKVSAADRGWNGEKLLAEIRTRCCRKGVRIVGEIVQMHTAGKDVADLGAIDVQSGHNDVGRLLVAQLEDDLGQIRFKDIDAGSLQEGIQLNLR
jgi:hypothetical protein